MFYTGLGAPQKVAGVASLKMKNPSEATAAAVKATNAAAQAAKSKAAAVKAVAEAQTADVAATRALIASNLATEAAAAAVSKAEVDRTAALVSHTYAHAAVETAASTAAATAASANVSRGQAHAATFLPACLLPPRRLDTSPAGSARRMLDERAKACAAEAGTETEGHGLLLTEDLTNAFNPAAACQAGEMCLAKPTEHDRGDFQFAQLETSGLGKVSSWTKLEIKALRFIAIAVIGLC